MILVAGATGVLGSEIVRRLAARGEEVRAMARATSAPEKVERLSAMGAEIVRADVKDMQTLRAATDGGGTKALIDAAKQAGAAKFVFVSFDTTKAPDNPLAKAKREAEKHLKQSGLDYTILHSTFFCESWLGPMLFADPVACTAKVYGKGTEKLRYVAVGDVAEFAVQSLTNPAAHNATIPIGGPEEISQLEAVRLFEEAYGRKFNVIEVSEAALEAQWISAENPFDKTFAGLMLGMARGFDTGMRPPFDQFPMQMTSPREYVRKQARDTGYSGGDVPRDITSSNGKTESRAELR